MIRFPRKRPLRWLLCVGAPTLVAGVLFFQHGHFSARESHPVSSETTRRPDPLDHVPVEERTQVVRELSMLSDATMEWTAEEMPAYWRLLRWTQNAPIKGSVTQVSSPRYMPLAYHELINRSKGLRGQPVTVDLHICRVVSYDAPANSLGIKTLYEVWGWSEDSRGALYVAVAPELPAGIKVGESVHYRGTLRGYFCKLQGYLAVGSPGRPTTTAAPLLIGRLNEYRDPQTVVATGQELWHGAAGLLLALSFVGILPRFSPLRTRKPVLASHVAARDPEALDAWINQPHGDESVLKEPPELEYDIDSSLRRRGA